MMAMQFWTKLVKQRTDPRLVLSRVGGILLMVSFGVWAALEKRGNSTELADVGMLAGFCILIVGWILRNGKRVQPSITDIEIMVSSAGVKIGDDRFPMDKIEDLDFLVNSYDGMRGPLVRWRRMVYNGCDNKLMFTLDGKKHSYTFFLEDEMAMRRLGMLFREFYNERVRFRERNRGGRTFLFEQMADRRAFERAKAREGFE
jgi:hypothetical protein